MWTYKAIAESFINTDTGIFPHANVNLKSMFKEQVKSPPRYFWEEAQWAESPCLFCSGLNQKRKSDEPPIPCIVHPYYRRCLVCILARVAHHQCGVSSDDSQGPNQLTSSTYHSADRGRGLTEYQRALEFVHFTADAQKRNGETWSDCEFITDRCNPSTKNAIETIMTNGTLATHECHECRKINDSRPAGEKRIPCIESRSFAHCALCILRGIRDGSCWRSEGGESAVTARRNEKDIAEPKSLRERIGSRSDEAVQEVPSRSEVEGDVLESIASGISKATTKNNERPCTAQDASYRNVSQVNGACKAATSSKSYGERSAQTTGDGKALEEENKSLKKEIERLRNQLNQSTKTLERIKEDCDAMKSRESNMQKLMRRWEAEIKKSE